MLFKVGLPALFLSIFFFTLTLEAAEVNEGDKAPYFQLQTHENISFKLADRLGKKWTILFFYPKAFTPGCTEQACSYGERIEEIHALGGEVYGISADSVAKQKEFHDKYKLNYTLLADPDRTAIDTYVDKIFLLGWAKRWTFILDEQLIVRKLFKNVDPGSDAEEVIHFIKNETH